MKRKDFELLFGGFLTQRTRNIKKSSEIKSKLSVLKQKALAYQRNPSLENESNKNEIFEMLHLTADLAEMKLVKLVREFENPEFDLDKKISTMEKLIGKLRQTLVYLNEHNMKKTAFLDPNMKREWGRDAVDKDGKTLNLDSTKSLGPQKEIRHIEIYLRCLIIIGSYHTFLKHVGHPNGENGYNLSIFINYLPNIYVNEKNLSPVIVAQFYTFLLLKILSQYFLSKKGRNLQDFDELENNSDSIKNSLKHKFYNVAKTFYKWLFKSLKIKKGDSLSVIQIAMVIFSKGHSLSENERYAIRFFLFMGVFFEVISFMLIEDKTIPIEKSYNLAMKKLEDEIKHKRGRKIKIDLMSQGIGLRSAHNSNYKNNRLKRSFSKSIHDSMVNKGGMRIPGSSAKKHSQSTRNLKKHARTSSMGSRRRPNSISKNKDFQFQSNFKPKFKYQSKSNRLSKNITPAQSALQSILYEQNFEEVEESSFFEGVYSGPKSHEFEILEELLKKIGGAVRPDYTLIVNKIKLQLHRRREILKIKSPKLKSLGFSKKLGNQENFETDISRDYHINIYENMHEFNKHQYDNQMKQAQKNSKKSKKQSQNFLYMSADITTKASTQKFVESLKSPKNFNFRMRKKLSTNIDNITPLFASSKKERPKSATPSGKYAKNQTTAKKIFAKKPEVLNSLQFDVESNFASPKSSIVMASSPKSFKIGSKNTTPARNRSQISLKNSRRKSAKLSYRALIKIKTDALKKKGRLMYNNQEDMTAKRQKNNIDSYLNPESEATETLNASKEKIDKTFKKQHSRGKSDGEGKSLFSVLEGLELNDDKDDFKPLPVEEDHNLKMGAIADELGTPPGKTVNRVQRQTGENYTLNTPIKLCKPSQLKNKFEKLKSGDKNVSQEMEAEIFYLWSQKEKIDFFLAAKKKNIFNLMHKRPKVSKKSKLSKKIKNLKKELEKKEKNLDENLDQHEAPPPDTEQINRDPKFPQNQSSKNLTREMLMTSIDGNGIYDTQDESSVHNINDPYETFAQNTSINLGKGQSLYDQKISQQLIDSGLISDVNHPVLQNLLQNHQKKIERSSTLSPDLANLTGMVTHDWLGQDATQINKTLNPSKHGRSIRRSLRQPRKANKVDRLKDNSPQTNRKFLRQNSKNSKVSKTSKNSMLHSIKEVGKKSTRSRRRRSSFNPEASAKRGSKRSPNMMFPPKGPGAVALSMKSSKFREKTKISSHSNIAQSNNQIFLRSKNDRLSRKDSNISVQNAPNGKHKFKKALLKLSTSFKFSKPGKKKDFSFQKKNSNTNLGTAILSLTKNKRMSMRNSPSPSKRQKKSPKRQLKLRMLNQPQLVRDSLEDFPENDQKQLSQNLSHSMNKESQNKQSFMQYVENIESKQRQTQSKFSSKTQMGESTILNQTAFTGSKNQLDTDKTVVVLKTPKDALDDIISVFQNYPKPYFERIKLLFAPVYFKREEFSAVRFEEIERLSLASLDSDAGSGVDKQTLKKEKMQVEISKLKTGWVDEEEVEMREILEHERAEKKERVNEDFLQYGLNFNDRIWSKSAILSKNAFLRNKFSIQREDLSQMRVQLVFNNSLQKFRNIVLDLTTLDSEMQEIKIQKNLMNKSLSKSKSISRSIHKSFAGEPTAKFLSGLSKKGNSKKRKNEMNIDSRGGSVLNWNGGATKNYSNILKYIGVTLGLAPDYHHTERVILRIDKAFYSEYSNSDSRSDFKFILLRKFLAQKLMNVDDGYMHILKFLISNDLRQDIGLRRKLMILFSLIVNLLCEKVVFLQYGNSYRCLSKLSNAKLLDMDEHRDEPIEPSRYGEVSEYELAIKLEKFKILVSEAKALRKARRLKSVEKMQDRTLDYLGYVNIIQEKGNYRQNDFPSMGDPNPHQEIPKMKVVNRVKELNDDASFSSKRMSHFMKSQGDSSKIESNLIKSKRISDDYESKNHSIDEPKNDANMSMNAGIFGFAGKNENLSEFGEDQRKSRTPNILADKRVSLFMNPKKNYFGSGKHIRRKQSPPGTREASPEQHQRARFISINEGKQLSRTFKRRNRRSKALVNTSRGTTPNKTQNTPSRVDSAEDSMANEVSLISEHNFIDQHMSSFQQRLNGGPGRGNRKSKFNQFNKFNKMKNNRGIPGKLPKRVSQYLSNPSTTTHVKVDKIKSWDQINALLIFGQLDKVNLNLKHNPCEYDLKFILEMIEDSNFSKFDAFFSQLRNREKSNLKGKMSGLHKIRPKMSPKIGVLNSQRGNTHRKSVNFNASFESINSSRKSQRGNSVFNLQMNKSQFGSPSQRRKTFMKKLTTKGIAFGEAGKLNPISLTKIKTHIVTSVFKINTNFIILRFFVDFNNLKSTMHDVSLDMGKSLNQSIMELCANNSRIDALGQSGLGISIQAYLKSSNFNLVNGTNPEYLAKNVQKVFEKKTETFLGGYGHGNILPECLDRLLVFDNMLIQQKMEILRLLHQNLELNEQCMKLKETQEPLCKWVEHILKEENSLTQEIDLLEEKSNKHNETGLLDLSRMSMKRSTFKRRGNKFTSKIDKIKLNVSQRSKLKKKTELLRKSKKILESQAVLFSSPQANPLRQYQLKKSLYNKSRNKFFTNKGFSQKKIEKLEEEEYFNLEDNLRKQSELSIQEKGNNDQNPTNFDNSPQNGAVFNPAQMKWPSGQNKFKNVDNMRVSLSKLARKPSAIMKKGPIPNHLRRDQAYNNQDLSYRLSISYLTGVPLGQSLLSSTNLLQNKRKNSIEYGGLGNILTQDISRNPSKFYHQGSSQGFYPVEENVKKYDTSHVNGFKGYKGAIPNANQNLQTFKDFVSFDEQNQKESYEQSGNFGQIQEEDSLNLKNDNILKTVEENDIPQSLLNFKTQSNVVSARNIAAIQSMTNLYKNFTPLEKDMSQSLDNVEYYGQFDEPYFFKFPWKNVVIQARIQKIESKKSKAEKQEEEEHETLENIKLEVTLNMQEFFNIF